MNDEQDKRDQLKQLYALYLADNQIVNQKTAGFVATSGLFIAALSVSGFRAEFGLPVAFVALMFTWYWHRSASWVDKYRVWYRDRIIERTTNLKDWNFFPTFEILDPKDKSDASFPPGELSPYKRSTSHRMLCNIFVLAYICWSLLGLLSAILLYRGL
jgi:hypothetical protein